MSGSIRRVQQIRPPGQPDAAVYAPDRDLAYVYVPALREAMASLDKVNWQDYFRGWLEAAGITDEAMADGVTLFCKAHTLFVSDPTIKSPADAFERVGFFSVPRPIRVMIYERIGEVMAGGFFVAVRDVTRQGQAPPSHVDLPGIIAAGASVVARLHGMRFDDLTPTNDTIEHLKGELEVTKNALRRQTELVEEAARDSAAIIRQVQDKLNATTAEGVRYLDLVTELRADLKHLEGLPASMPWYSRLWWLAQVFFTTKLE